MKDSNALISSFNERIEGAVSEEKLKRYSNAVELYYKAMVHMIDYLLFLKKDIIVDNLDQRLKDISKLDKDIVVLFREAHLLYRETYRSKKDLLDCKKLKNDIKTIARLSRTEEVLQESLKKIS